MRNSRLKLKNDGCSRPGWARLAACFSLALLAVAGRLSAASFTATLDRDTIQVGESATLSLRLEGGTATGTPGLPAIPNLNVAYAGPMHVDMNINGQRSSIDTYTFSVTPTQPGEYAIPALRANVDGKILTSQPLQLKAVKASAAAEGGEQLAFLRLIVPKSEAFVGEVIEVQAQLYLREGVANAQQVFQWFENLGSGAFKAEGFSLLKTAQSQQLQRTQVGNGIYVFATLSASLSPVKTGPLTIDSVNATLPLQLPATNRRRDAFDPFGMFAQYEQRNTAIAAEARTLIAQPLPRENAPADFTGAVGNYSLTVTAGPTNVAVGDPVTVKIQISGRGSLDALTLPAQTAWQNFKAYPPTAKVETTDPLGLQGSKTFEEVVTPATADLKALPPVSFSFFDPEQKTYRTLTQPALTLVVRPSSPVAQPVVAGSTRAAPDSQPQTQDIIYIKQHPGAVAPLGPPLVGQPWFLAVQGAPVLALLASVVWRRRSESLANNPRLRRQRQVAQTVRAGLDDLRKFAGEKNSDKFFATLFRLLQEQLGERLDLPATAITEAVVEEHLQPRGVPEPTTAAVRELFQACNLARYAPIKSSQELAAFIPKVTDALRQLQEIPA